MAARRFDDKDTAQRCKSTGEIISLIRTGCPCGCSPDLGYLNVHNGNAGALREARYSGREQQFYQSVWVDMSPTDVRGGA